MSETTSAEGAEIVAVQPLTDDEAWDYALQTIRGIDGNRHDAILGYARTWADSTEIDYDDGPASIGFTRDGETYWFLIEDGCCSWDIDNPLEAMLNTLINELAELKGQRDGR